MVVALLIVLTMVMGACGKNDKTPGNNGNNNGSNTSDNTGDDQSLSGKGLNIMYVNQGTLGDLGVGDIVMEALEDYAANTGSKVNVYECNADASKYLPTMLDVAGSGEYDLIVTGYYSMLEAAMAAAEEYPEQ